MTELGNIDCSVCANSLRYLGGVPASGGRGILKKLVRLIRSERLGDYRRFWKPVVPGGIDVSPHRQRCRYFRESKGFLKQPPPPPQRWGLHRIPGEAVPVVDCSHCLKKKPNNRKPNPEFVLYGDEILSPGTDLYLSSSVWLLVKRVPLSSLCSPPLK